MWQLSGQLSEGLRPDCTHTPVNWVSGWQIARVVAVVSMPVQCPVNGSWNCAECPYEVMCYRMVHKYLMEAGLPDEIAWVIAIAWKYDTNEIWW